MYTKSNELEHLVAQIHQGICTPVIGTRLMAEMVFGPPLVASQWANHIGYPLADGHNLTRVAQFASVVEGDPERIKSDFLAFLKERLLALARAEPDADLSLLKRAAHQAPTTSFTDLVCAVLPRLDFQTPPTNPLSILAALEIPVYLTTSPWQLLEKALKVNGREPRTEVYIWNQGLKRSVPPAMRPDLNFSPSIKTPLVFHLHGIEDDPGSLVLTEDDYMEFLVNITGDLNDTNIFPAEVRDTITSSRLLLVGYRMHAWDLRVFVQIIKKLQRRRPGFAIQLEPTAADHILHPEQFHIYLERYFKSAQFKIFWDTPQNFLSALWQAWNGG